MNANARIHSVLNFEMVSARKGSFCTHTMLHEALFCAAAVEKSACARKLDGGAFELTNQQQQQQQLAWGGLSVSGYL